MKTRAVTIVPALPNWFVAVLIRGGTDKDTGEKWDDAFIFDPVLAWEIERVEQPYHPIANIHPDELCVTCHVTPIVLDGRIDDSTGNQWAIKRADGHFEIPGDRTFDKETEVLAYLVERDEKEKKRREAAKKATA